MVKIKKKVEEESKIAPASTPEARENQMIALAIDLAEKQLRKGTASAQVITHYLKLGTEKAKLENEKLESENELLKAKVETLKSQQRSEELYQQAINAMKSYAGLNSIEEEFGEDDEEDIF